MMLLRFQMLKYERNYVRIGVMTANYCIPTISVRQLRCMIFESVFEIFEDYYKKMKHLSFCSTPVSLSIAPVVKLLTDITQSFYIGDFTGVKQSLNLIICL